MDLRAFSKKILRTSSAGSAASGFVLSLFACAALHAGQIDFSGLPGSDGDPFSNYTENGFSVTATSGSWYQSFSYGNPSPSIFLDATAVNPDGSLTVTSSLGDFSFSQVDFSSNNGATDYSIQGLLSSVQQFTQTGTEAATNGPYTFSTVVSANNALIDTLVISLTPSGQAFSFNVDNLAYSLPGDLPEPSGLALFCVGSLAIGGRNGTRAGVLCSSVSASTGLVVMSGSVARAAAR